MADSIPDIHIPLGVWTNLYTATGISVGTALTIQNKASYDLQLYLSATAPSSATSGVLVQPYGVADVDVGSTGCWAYGNGSASVQNNS